VLIKILFSFHKKTLEYVKLSGACSALAMLTCSLYKCSLVALKMGSDEQMLLENLPAKGPGPLLALTSWFS
jgi:hypothetical protein